VRDPLRYGIVGAGMMGREHLQNLAVLDGVEAVAVADPHGPSREHALAIAPGLDVYDDAARLFARDDLDAIVIATPNHTHHDVIARAAAAGAHLLIEKPLCTTVDDCRDAVARLAGYPAIAWVGMEYRYAPPVARLIDEVRAGTAGRLRMLAIREHRFPFLPKVDDWNRFARNTGGTLVEKCCHFFDLMRLITGARAERVYASGAQDVNHLDERYGGETPDILDNAFVIVDFEGGARAMLDLCMFAEQSENQTEIAATGDDGKIEVRTPESALVIGRRVRPTPPGVRRDAARIERIPVAVDETAMAAGTHHGATYYEHVAFRDAIRDGGTPAVTLEDGLMAVAIGAAAERSIAERRPVLMAEFGL
jgi:predicted dehydrogenase